MMSDEPLKLTEKQRELCRRLDDFYASAKMSGVRPSDMFQGAIYALRHEVQSVNPDWMAQAAHSLRDLIYPFYKKSERKRSKAVFKKYGTAGDVDDLGEKVGLYYEFFSEVAHHNWKAVSRRQIFQPIIQEGGSDNEIFGVAFAGFENVLYSALRRQLDAHTEIDRFIAGSSRDVSNLRDLLGVNFDTRQYFFASAPPDYIDWLDINGFLDPIRQPVSEATKYSYRTPELDFLARAATAEPEKVTNIMLSVNALPERFNPEVIDRSLWLCQSLPAQQVARVIPKVRGENWPKLMARFNFHSFGYERIFQTLAKAGDDASILALAEALLVTRQKEDRGKSLESYRRPVGAFCVRDLAYTKVFQHLVRIHDNSGEKAFTVAARCFRRLVELGDVRERPPFAIEDIFSLYDQDLFEIKVGNDVSRTDRDEIHDLVASLISLARRVIGSQCSNAEAVRRLYSDWIFAIPDSRSSWQLRLVILTLCPNVGAI